MDVIITILMMMIVGGFIGGLTNSLAIKMLFRPYEAKYIGKWRIPFTPGVIPKRRDQLALQLGQLVVEHLLTVDSIKNKLQDESLKKVVSHKVEKELDNFSKSSITVRQFLHQYDVVINDSLIKENIAKKIVDELYLFFEDNKHTPLKHWMDEIVSEKDLETATQFLREKGITIVNKEETKEKIATIMQHYLETKGFMANMVLSMFSTSELAGKIQDLIIQYLRSEDGYRWIHHTVVQEWEQLKEHEVHNITRILSKSNTKAMIQSFVQEQINVEQWLDKPVADWLHPYLPKIKATILPRIVETVFEKLSNSIPQVLKQLEVEKMVENQVVAFPTSRIEKLVLSITSKEFKLITYLGVLLGGLIGLIQALIFILV